MNHVAVGLSLGLLYSSPMFFSFEQYSKVSITKSFILKKFALHRIKNFKFNVFIKKENNATHTYVHICIYIVVIQIIRNGEM